MVFVHEILFSLKLNYPQLEMFLILHEFTRLAENKNIIAMYLFGSHAKKTAKATKHTAETIFNAKRDFGVIDISPTIQCIFPLKFFC